MIRNQRGVTLIELLATITILSISGVIIWNVFLQGNIYSQKSMAKNTIEQEANILSANITKIYQTSKQFQIDSSNCQVNVTFTKQDNTVQSQLFSSNRVCYSASNTGPVNPGQTDTNLTITVSDLKDLNNSLTITTLLYRLKDGGI